MLGSEPEWSRLFRVKKTLLEMIQDRGYSVGEGELAQTPEAFKELAESKGDTARELLNNLYSKADGSEKIMVFVAEAPKVGVKDIKECAMKMQTEAVSRAIMVVQEGLTAFARSALAEMQSKYRIEVFNDTELVVNITKHVLVPKHVILSPESKATLLHRYKCKEHQLPRIQATDPVARYFGASRGDVFKIIRNSETAGLYIFYRLVV